LLLILFFFFQSLNKQVMLNYCLLTRRLFPKCRFPDR